MNHDLMIPASDSGAIDFGEPVVLDDARWNELVAASEAGVAAWNALLDYWHQADRTRIEIHLADDDGFAYLATTRLRYQKRASVLAIRGGSQSSGAGWGVVRQRSTGRIARLKGVDNGRPRGTRGMDLDFPLVPIPNPKSWRGLGGKPIDKVLAKLQLLDFTEHVHERVNYETAQAFAAGRKDTEQ